MSIICIASAVFISCSSSVIAPPAVSESTATAAATPAEESPAPSERPFSLRSSTLTGDWNGRRPAFEDRGFRFNLFLNDQYGAVLGGGRETNGAGRNAASIDALLSFDLDQLGVVKDAEALLHLQSNWGAGINPRTGALYQVNDDSDGSIGMHVAQFWYRHHFLKHRIALQVGYLDYQTIVDRNAYANSEDKQFMHQTLDNNPLVPLRIGMGANVTIKPTTWYTLILGIADGQAAPYKGGISRAFHEEDWYTAYAEQGLHAKWSSERGPLPGNYRLGAFYDPGPRATFPRSSRDRRTRAGDYGLYASFDQMLYREGAEDDQGLGAFLRFGYRNPENNRLSRFWSGGLAYTGLIPGRDGDVLGAAFSLLRPSHQYRHRVDAEFGNETVYELYYAIQVAKWLVVTPDIQYVDNPGGTDTLSHTLVAGLRVRVSF